MELAKLCISHCTITVTVLLSCRMYTNMLRLETYYKKCLFLQRLWGIFSVLLVQQPLI